MILELFIIYKLYRTIIINITLSFLYQFCMSRLEELKQIMYKSKDLSETASVNFT